MAAPYSYGVVEKALARAFSRGPHHTPALRARLKHLMGLGLAAARPGKGRKIEYGDDDVIKLYIALELEALGIDPKKAVHFVLFNWDQVRVSGPDLLPKLVADARKRDDVFFVVHLDFLNDQNSPVISGHGGQSGLKALGNWLSARGGRVGLFNLSTRIRVLDEALETFQEEA